MNLSLEEINRQLEEYPHDLTIWREWLVYTRRYDLPHDRYIDYLEKEGYLSKTSRDRIWTMSKGKHLEVLCGVRTKKLRVLNIYGRDIESTVGIEALIAPKLTDLTLQEVNNFEITKIFPKMTILDSMVNFSDTADLNALTSLTLENTSILNIDRIYEAVNLVGLTIQDTKSAFKITTFEKLRILSGTPNSLKKMGNSDTVEHIYTDYHLNHLMNKGWYPNLEYPFKGKNKR